MRNPWFQFKQFKINQAKSEMKLGVDSVLLGSWTKIEKPNRILDIGTGTGVLALMMAQKTTDSIIDAIDIDALSVEQANENFQISKWNERLSAIHTSLQNFKPSYKYDFIISNPPYFRNSQKNLSQRKTQVRHTDSLDYAELIKFVNHYLSENGTFSFVFPYSEFHYVKSILDSYGLCVNNELQVQGKENGEIIRLCLLVSRVCEEKTVVKIHVRDEKSGVYSKEYKKITDKFYI